MFVSSETQTAPTNGMVSKKNVVMTTGDNLRIPDRALMAEGAVGSFSILEAGGRMSFKDPFSVVSTKIPG